MTNQHNTSFLQHCVICQSIMMIIAIESRCWLTSNADICTDEQCWHQWVQESMKHSVESAFLKWQAEEFTMWWWQISQWDLSVWRSLWHQKDKNANDADTDLSFLWLSCHSDDINESSI